MPDALRPDDPDLRAALAGEIAPSLALMRLMLPGRTAAALLAELDAIPDAAPLAAAARAQAEGLARLEALVAAGATHAPGTGLGATRAMFDRLVAISPEASVAAWSLGDPGLLDAATAELVAWLDRLGLLDGSPRILDLGCGIGRIAAAVAPRAAEVLGLDLSPAMVAAARARVGAAPNLGFDTTCGEDLRPLPDAAFDLVLAIDVFPYLAQAGAEARMLAECARILRPGGHLLVMNWRYDPAPAGQPGLPALAAASGLALRLDGARPLAAWDGTAFLLARPG